MKLKRLLHERKKAKSTYKSVMGSLRISIISFIILCEGAIALKYECDPSNEISSELGVANCSSQQLAHVPTNLPHNIKVLDLSNNFISHLADYSFYKYEYLEILHLRNNSLAQLETLTFSRLKTLLYLDLSFNSLDTVPSHAFQNVKTTLTLSLAGNKLTSIRSNSFQYFTKVTNLYLSGNHIKQIDPDAFQGLGNLQRLELQNNLLSTLDRPTFRFFNSDFKEVKLFNNPWYCDCNLRWLMQWLKNGGSSDTRLQWKFNSNEPVCKGPDLVKDKAFTSLTDEWFLCPITMYSKAHDLETNMGSNVQLFCKYLADPPVELQWLKNGKLLDLTQTSKYKTETEGEIIVTNRLVVHDFQYDDIGKYHCLAENRLGQAFDSCVVTLVGVGPSSVLISDKTKMDENKKDQVRIAIIVFLIIGGVVCFLIAFATAYCAVTRCQRDQRKKTESIRISFKENLKANGISESCGMNEPMIYDTPIAPDKTLSKYIAEESHSMYNSPPITNIHFLKNSSAKPSQPKETISVGTREKQTSYHSKGSDTSQRESTTHLLQNVSPILTDQYNKHHLREPRAHVPRHYVSTNHYLNVHRYDDRYSQFIFPREKNGFKSLLDDSGLPMSRNTKKYIPYRTSALPYNEHVIHNELHIDRETITLPHGYSPSHMTEYSSIPVVRSSSVSAIHKSLSAGHLTLNPPKKPPRVFNSGDTLCLHSQTNSGKRENGLKLSLPNSGLVDQHKHV